MERWKEITGHYEKCEFENDDGLCLNWENKSMECSKENCPLEEKDDD